MTSINIWKCDCTGRTFKYNHQRKEHWMRNHYICYPIGPMNFYETCQSAPFYCAFCKGWYSSDMEGLQHHYNFKHKQWECNGDSMEIAFNTVKPWKCRLCNEKRFRLASHLKAHLTTRHFSATINYKWDSEQEKCEKKL